ncbi:hypothetical protein PDUR_10090 [Paenibacillus durus]|uniref:Uncharacterized protein n=2 Tax=Paenibacillus durus TaxID=44251 RepID=A0A089HPB9_PAEDU|nr:hypothetical protein PDUR_10090 [Paenibacillus durus]
MSNFIQLVLQQEDTGIKLDFFQPWVTWVPYSCPFLDIQLLNKDIFEKFNDSSNIIKSITDRIDSGYYVYMSVNHKYLSCSNVQWYKRINIAHELFIYGYNMEKMILNVADNFGGKYEFKDCSFYEFIQSYINPANINLHHYNRVILMKLNKDINAELDILRISDLLTDYLESRDTRIRDDGSVNWAKNSFLGISVYDKIIEYLYLLLEDKCEYDIRFLHILWEHKKCMVYRMKLLEEKQVLQDSKFYEMYKKIENDAFIQRSLMIKFYINKNKDIITDMILWLKSLKETEELLLRELLELLTRSQMSDPKYVLGNSHDISLKWSLVQL